MAFDQSHIVEVLPAVRSQGQTWISWISDAGPGAWYQLYLNRHLAWDGTETHAALTTTPGDHIEIGTVNADEAQTDFSAFLPPSPLDRAVLTWQGGTYEDPTGGDDVAGFRIFGEHMPGGGIDYAVVLADITAYPAGIVNDGYGSGGFGQGGYGRAASTYTWTSAPLWSGVWSFAVRTYDKALNISGSTLASVDVRVPPQPPARNAAGKRLTYSYDNATRLASLQWLASPG